MAASLEQFVKALDDIGLLPADDAAALLYSLPPEKRPQDAQAFARLLVQQAKLTQFQAQAVYQGKAKGLVFGEYIVLDKLGVGGMGQVFKAQHRRMKRVVALKVISPAAMKEPAAIRRFQREVEAAARLSHPNIVTAYDASEQHGAHFLVMEYVEGGDLSSVVKKQGPLAVDQAINCILQAARGLAYAHAEGIIHRDIKPANLLLDKKGTVKILDMGLARFEDGSSDGLTGTDQVMGTVDYMSPEQAAETKTADARSDMYSLGCTLWYLLTGRRMFDGDSAVKRIMQHVNAPVPSLCQTRDEVPWALDQIYQKMVAKKPPDRYASMAEVVQGLEELQAGSSGLTRLAASSDDSRLANAFDFSQLDGPTPSAAKAAPTRPAPSAAPVDKPTESRVAADAETDPKSEILVPARKSATGAKREPSGAGRKGGRRFVMLGAGGAAAALVLASVAILLKGKHGEETRLEVPAGTAMKIEKGGPDSPTIPATSESGKLKAAIATPPTRPTIDLLKLVDPVRDSRNGAWTLAGGKLISPNAAGTLEIPFTPPDEYQVTIQTRFAGPGPEAVLRIGLPVGTQRISAVTSAFSGKLSGLELLDGLYANNNDNPTRVERPVLADKKPHTLVYTVSPERVQVIADGKTLIDYTVRDRLADPEAKWLGDLTHLSLASRATCEISKLELLPQGEASSQQQSQRFHLPLPGLVADPTPLPTLGRWQIDTRALRGTVTALACSPDGKLIASATSTQGCNQIRIYDADTWRLIAVPVGHDPYSAIKALAWSPDGKLLASGGTDIWLWKFDGTPVRRFNSWASSVAWSPDGKSLASAGGNDGTVLIWSVDGKSSSILTPSKSIVRAVAWSPDGRQLVAGGEDKTARVMTVAGKLGPVLTRHEAIVTTVAWSRLGQIATGDASGSVRLWQADGKPSLAMKEPIVIGDEIRSLDWTPDGRILAIAPAGSRPALLSADGKLSSLDVPTSKSWLAAWSGDGQRLALSLGNISLGIWQSGREWAPLLGYYTQSTAIAWSPDGRRLIGLDGNRRAVVRRADGSLLANWPAGGNSAVAWSPDGKQVATGGSDDNLVRIWTADGQPGPVLTGHTDQIQAVTWSPDGKQLASASSDKTIRTWTAEGKPVRELKSGQASVQCLAWSKQGQLASGGNDHKVSFWKSDGSRGPVFDAPDTINSLDWSPDGQQLLAGGSGHIFLLNPAGKLDAKLRTHSGGVFAMFGPDGKQWVSTAWGDPTVRIWNTAQRDVEQFFLGPTNGMRPTWSSTGMIALACGDRTIRTWDPAGARPLWTAITLTAETATFSSRGKVMEITGFEEQELVYLLDRGAGRIEVFKPSEFVALAKAAAKGERADNGK